jgi:GTP pyrophosphokinase
MVSFNKILHFITFFSGLFYLKIVLVFIPLHKSEKGMRKEVDAKYFEVIRSIPFTDIESSKIRKAYEKVFAVLDGRTRENGDPFIFHALNVADIVANEIGLGANVITAVFLHEADSTEKLNRVALKNEYGAEITNIVESLSKISKIDIKTTGLQAEAFRKLIVSYSTDPRVILVKLADRLEVMRSLSFFPKSKHSKKSAETLLLYTPLAHKLGLYKLKSELEDLSLRYTEPAAYRDITAKLYLAERSRKMLVRNFVAPIEQELRQQGLEFAIKHRTKSIYSIWNKMQKQGVPFDKVYDVFAIRIILDSQLEHEKDDCWKAYSIITSRYEPDVKRLRDWVTVPKESGYESLHTTVKVDNGQYVEVQIRTQRMDDYAEHGKAAHWRYKGVKQEEGGIESWLNNIRYQLETTTSPEEIKKSFTPNEIFVYTPAGDLRQLPVGATVLDFAFDIHSNLGSKCTGALRNGKNISIREVLQTGDTVEIITSKNQAPTTDWLNIVVTSKAKSNIKQKLRADEAKVAALGKEILDRKIKNRKIPLHTDPIALLTKHFKFKTTTELYVKVALEELDISLINEVLTKVSQPEKAEKEVAGVEQQGQQQDKSAKSSDYIIVDEKLSNVEYKLGKCCSPVYGDDVFGFVTIGSGITIHRTTCPNAERLISQYGYRIIPAKWRQQEDAGSFQAIIKITANDEVGITQKIAEVVNATQCVIRTVQLTPIKGILEGSVRVFVKNVKQLDMLLYKLNHLKGVIKATRMN